MFDKIYKLEKVGIYALKYSNKKTYPLKKRMLKAVLIVQVKML
jgi:hypothetical protein